MNEVIQIDETRILVRFAGVVDSDAAVSAADELLRLLGDNHGVSLWFDVREVISYPSGAREAWQQALLPRRKQFAEIGVASTSALTKLGGTMFAMFLRIPFRSLSAADLAEWSG